MLFTHRYVVNKSTPCGAARRKPCIGALRASALSNLEISAGTWRRMSRPTCNRDWQMALMKRRCGIALYLRPACALIVNLSRGPASEGEAEGCRASALCGQKMSWPMPDSRRVATADASFADRQLPWRKRIMACMANAWPRLFLRSVVAWLRRHLHGNICKNDR